MKLDHRHIRFVTPFWPTLARKVRLSGRRGSVHLQETALVVEGELMRFSLFGLEWLFRRALVEWTTVTVPYSRITTARYRRLVLLRVLSVLLTAGVWLVCYFAIQEGDAAADLVFGTVGVTVTLLIGYVNLRLKPSYRVVYRNKDGRRRLLGFRIKPAAVRTAFADALAAHRQAAARYAPTKG